MAMGIIAAQCISNPLTQFVIDSKHLSGVGGGTRTSTIDRVKEIVGAKLTTKMKNPTMSLRVNKELENNKNIVQEITNNIKMLNFSHFILNIQIFFEQYNNPVHPKYKHEKEFIKLFEMPIRKINGSSQFDVLY